MKYLKLYEAFESVKLGKTLEFIEKESRKIFLDSINKVGSFLDFPISEFKDEYFEYLPFKSALKKNINADEKVDDVPKPCTATSLSLFKDAGITGETCQAGRIKRKWGVGVRTVACTSCNGSGFEKSKPKKSTIELGLIKFWFSKDGKFITVTGTDGNIINQTGTDVEFTSFSKDIEDYNIGHDLSFDDIKKLTTGDIVYFTNRRDNQPVVSYVYVERGRHTYFLQDLYAGNEANNSRVWKKFAKCSWIIGRNEDFFNCKLLIPKSKDENTDFYSINNTINLNNMSVSTNRDMNKRLSESHFAIVLDFKKLKNIANNKDFISRSSIKDKRIASKKDALVFVKPESIKTANIKRYLDKLSNKFELNKGLSEIDKVIPRAIGWSNSLIFLLRSININDIQRLISLIYEFMRETNTNYQKNTELQIISKLKVIYNKTSDLNQIINKNIISTNESFKDMLKDDSYDKEKLKLSIDIFNTFIEMGSELNKSVSTPVQNLTDLELILSKIYSLQRIWGSDRFKHLVRLRYVIEYLSTNYEYNIAREMYEEVSNKELVLEDLKEFRTLIKRI